MSQTPISWSGLFSGGIRWRSLGQLRELVLAAPEEVYLDHKAVALARIEQRDPDDWPILATALALECPIWTEDNDFFGAGVPTWTTDRVEIYLSSAD